MDMKIEEKEHKEKLKLKKENDEYYQGKLKELGLSSMDHFAKSISDPAEFIKKGIVYAHKDFDKVLEAIAKKKPWAIVSGINPSGPLHFGHKALFDGLLWLQKLGADIYIPLSNDESYVVGKKPSLGEARRTAYEEVIPSIIAMGFDPKKTHIFVDSDYLDIYNLAMRASSKLTVNRIEKVFGVDDKAENPGTLFYRGAVQLAHILLPQITEFGGPKPTLVPVGIDQHPYILLSRDIAEKMNMIPPGEIIVKFLPSLKGPETKMSASIYGSSLFLTDSEETAERVLKQAYTGGLTSGEAQKKLGGVPEICPIFLMQQYHFMDKKTADELCERCKNGKILCGECKKNTIDFVKDYLKKHKKEREKAKKDIDKFMLKTKIKSVLE